MGSHLAAVAGIELISLAMLTLNLWQSHLILLSAGNTGVCHHAQLIIFYLCRFFVVVLGVRVCHYTQLLSCFFKTHYFDPF